MVPSSVSLQLAMTCSSSLIVSSDANLYLRLSVLLSHYISHLFIFLFIVLYTAHCWAAFQIMDEVSFKMPSHMPCTALFDVGSRGQLWMYKTWLLFVFSLFCHAGPVSHYPLSTHTCARMHTHLHAHTHTDSKNSTNDRLTTDKTVSGIIMWEYWCVF